MTAMMSANCYNKIKMQKFKNAKNSSELLYLYLVDLCYHAAKDKFFWRFGDFVADFV